MRRMRRGVTSLALLAAMVLLMGRPTAARSRLSWCLWRLLLGDALVEQLWLGLMMMVEKAVCRRWIAARQLVLLGVVVLASRAQLPSHLMNPLLAFACLAQAHESLEDGCLLAGAAWRLEPLNMAAAEFSQTEAHFVSCRRPPK